VKYEEVLDKYINLLSSYPLSDRFFELSYDDFTNYLKIDPDNSFSVSSSEVRWVDMDRQIGRQLWRNYDTVLTGDFVHKLTFGIEEIEPGDSDPREMVRLWTVRGGDVSVIFYAVQSKTSDDEFNVVFFQRTGDGNLFVYYSSENDDPLLVGEEYYTMITKQDDKYRLFVFDEMGIRVDSGQLQGISFDCKTLSIASVGGYSSDLEDWSSGYVTNLKIYD